MTWVDSFRTLRGSVESALAPAWVSVIPVGVIDGRDRELTVSVLPRNKRRGSGCRSLGVMGNSVSGWVCKRQHGRPVNQCDCVGNIDTALVTCGSS